MTENTLATLARLAPWAGLALAGVSTVAAISVGAPALAIEAGMGVTVGFGILGGLVEGQVLVMRRRMVVDMNPPPGESGPRVSIPWHVAQALSGNEWVTLPMPFGLGTDPWRRVAEWLARPKGAAPVWCPGCQTLRLGYPVSDAPMQHLPSCRRGHAMEALRICMEQAASAHERGEV